MATNESSPTTPRPPPSLGRHLVFAAGAGRAVAQRMLDPHGLSLAQWAVLSSIWHNGALGIKDIAALTGNAPPAASRIVDRMIAAGLLRRRPRDTDRRAVLVDVSDRGEALRHLHAIYARVNDVLAADLSPDETRQLFALLDRVEAGARAWLEEDATNTDAS